MLGAIQNVDLEPHRAWEVPESPGDAYLFLASKHCPFFQYI